jgi:hypothetical protein
VVIATNAWSTLFTLPANVSAATNAPSAIPRIGKAYGFYAFQFSRSGSTSLVGNASQSNWCVTLVNAIDLNGQGLTLPRNYTTVTIDPYNGSLKTYRPGL